VIRKNSQSLRRRFRARGGFTLVELIVAIIILVVGVLGLASAAAVVMRQITGSSFQNRAAAIAQSRFEQLRAIPCANAVGGTASSGGVTERWNVQMLTRTMQLTDVVTWREKNTQRTVTFSSIRPCI